MKLLLVPLLAISLLALSSTSNAAPVDHGGASAPYARASGAIPTAAPAHAAVDLQLASAQPVDARHVVEVSAVPDVADRNYSPPLELPFVASVENTSSPSEAAAIYAQTCVQVILTPDGATSTRAVRLNC